MSILNGNITDVLELQSQIKHLQDENRELKKALELWKPVITIELDYDRRTINSEIKQLNKVYRTSISSDYLAQSHITTEDLSSIICKDLNIIFTDFLKMSIHSRLEIINDNINQLKRGNKW